MIDLRSDTVTQPPQEMRQAMANAQTGDDYYGDDPTVKRLESMSAEMLGKEAALFVTSGTMGNLVAILAQTGRGDSIICESMSHIFHNERGHVAGVCGVLPIHLDGPRGRIDPVSIESSVFRENVLNAPTRLICLENTHNIHGGTCLGPKYLTQIRVLADKLKLAVHMDGARIFNAAIAQKTTAATLAKPADSLTFCLSKGLACPFGSLVVGGQEFIREARFHRQMVGGGMRQAGAGVFALRRMINRLQEDHDNAQLLAEGLQDATFDVQIDRVETNMVFFHLPQGGPSDRDFLKGIKDQGILCNSPKGGRFRMVTHYGISKSDITKAICAASRLLNSTFPS